MKNLFEELEHQQKDNKDHLRKSHTSSKFSRALSANRLSDIEDEVIINPDNHNQEENIHYKFE